MDFSGIIEFFQHFQTDRVMERLSQYNLGELISNPWFLGISAALALLALFMKWRLLLATILGSLGFTWLLSYTMARGTSLNEGTNDAMLIFIGGGVVLVGLVIYLVFIRAD